MGVTSAKCTTLGLDRVCAGRAADDVMNSNLSKKILRKRLPPAAERLSNSEALLSRTDLRELGLERRAVDAVFRALPVIVLPGYRRPLVRVADYVELLERSTYGGDRVR